MTDIRKIVLYGNSLFMVGVEAGLKGKDGLDVLRIDATLPGAGQRLNALRPAAVVFDLADPPSGFVLPFLREHLGLPLIGLDVSSNTVTVLYSQGYTATTVADLAQVIQAQLAESSNTAETDGSEHLF